jgi:hypothetical protein
VTKEKAYVVLLESQGVALLPKRFDKSELEILKGLTAFLTSIQPPGDDRREIKDSPQVIQDLAGSVALLCDADRLSPQGDGTQKLLTEPAGLISGTTFWEQERVRDGFTGFLVGEDLLLTTSHEVNVKTLRIVFDFILDSNSVPKTIYSDNEVFAATEVKRGDIVAGEDWLLLKLDRSPGRPFQERIETQAEPLGTSLWMLGHPLGLPMKFVDNSKITTEGSVVFECDLDASQGNSGSLVLNATSNKVVGALQGAAPAFANGIWLWCPPNKKCPTIVTSSLTFAAAVAAASP